MADTIFLIHGMWGGPWYWNDFRRILEGEGYRCLAPPLPYHDVAPGSSPSPGLATASLLDYADALEKEISRLGAKPILMGHSMGGLLAQMLASRGLAEAVVLLSPASPAGILAMRPSVIRAFWSIATRWGFWRQPMRQTFGEAAYSMLHRLPPEEQKRTYDKFVHESGRAFFEIAFWVLDSKIASGVDDTKVRCPMLIIAGGKDRMTPPSVVRRVAMKYRAVSTYKQFDHHAHWLVGEPGWEDVARDVCGWLAALPTPAAAAIPPNPAHGLPGTVARR